jgi:DNA-binding NarL/FixJ family response regulator
MFVRLAVSDPLPVYRQGVMAALGEAGFESEAPDDLLEWARHDERRVILLTVHAAADWTLLADLSQIRPTLVVVAVLDDASVAGYVRALSAGAAGAVPRDASPAVIRAAFEAAVNGDTLLPIEVVRALAAQPQSPQPAGEPSTREIGWLRDLAQGLSVARLANRAGYSERMMFRLLRDLYTKLGAANRTEALIRARDRGWV